MSGSSDNNAPRIHTSRDHLQTAVHYGAATAVTVATGAWAGFGIITGVVVLGGIAYASHRIKKSRQTIDFGNLFLRRQKSPAEAPDLLETTAALTEKAGLGKSPIVYDFQINAREMTKEVNLLNKQKPGTPINPDSKLGKLIEEMPKISNAVAVGDGKPPVFMISTPLIKSLSAEETKAVMAHEVTHNAAQHSSAHLPLRMLGIGAQVAATIGIYITVGSLGGAIPVIATIAAAIAAPTLVKKLFPKPAAANTAEPRVSLKNRIIIGKMYDQFKSRAERAKANRRKVILGASGDLAMLGVASLFVTPAPVVGALLIRRGAQLAHAFLDKSYSRRNEFQADRGAAALGADPLALATGLRKLTEERRLQNPQKAAAEAARARLPHIRISRAVESLFSTHPNSRRRIKRLAGIARQQGRSAEDIAAAVSGPITFPAPPSPPPAPPANGNRALLAG